MPGPCIRRAASSMRQLHLPLLYCSLLTATLQQQSLLLNSITPGYEGPPGNQRSGHLAGLIQAPGWQEAMHLNHALSLAAAGCVWGHHPLERADDHVFLEGCICTNLWQHHSHQGEQQPALVELVLASTSSRVEMAVCRQGRYSQTVCSFSLWMLHQKIHLFSLPEITHLAGPAAINGMIPLPRCCIWWHEIMLNAAAVVLC